MERRNADLLLGCFTLALSVGLYVHIRAESWYRPDLSIIDDASFFPLAACYLLFALSLINIFKAWKRNEKGSKVYVNLRGIALVILWTGYALCLNSLGFLPAGCLALIVSQLLCGETRWKLLLPVSIGLPLFLYATLGKMMGISFPKGILPF